MWQYQARTAIRKIEEIKKELGKQYSPVDELPLIMMTQECEELYDLETIRIKC